MKPITGILPNIPTINKNVRLIPNQSKKFCLIILAAFISQLIPAAASQEFGSDNSCGRRSPYLSVYGKSGGTLLDFCSDTFGSGRSELLDIDIISLKVAVKNKTRVSKNKMSIL